MSGHLRERPPGSGAWELRWRVAGRVCTKTVHGNKTQARIELRAVEVAADRGEHIEPTKITVEQFVVERIKLWQVSPRTREHYEQLGKLITARLGAIPLQKLTTLDVERWHRGAAVAPSTLRHAHGLLVRVLRDAQRHKLLHVNVAKEQLPPRAPAGKVKVPTEDLIPRMLARLRGSEFYVPAVLTVNTGVRRSEMLALRWCDVGLDKAVLTVARALEETAASGITVKGPKTESGERTIAIGCFDGLCMDLFLLEKAIEVIEPDEWVEATGFDPRLG